VYETASMPISGIVAAARATIRASAVHAVRRMLWPSTLATAKPTMHDRPRAWTAVGTSASTTAVIG